MNEDEVKVINKLKQTIDFNSSLYIDDLGDNDIKIILNLIERQQKEIEDLKAITQNYNAIGGETFGDDRIIVCSMKYFDDGFFKRNYIFKNVLRELIKNNEQDIDYSIHDLIEDLKKILEED